MYTIYSYLKHLDGVSHYTDYLTFKEFNLFIRCTPVPLSLMWQYLNKAGTLFKTRALQFQKSIMQKRQRTSWLGFVWNLTMTFFAFSALQFGKKEVWKCTVYPKKYAHGFVVLCFVVVMQSFITNSHEVFIHIHQGCFVGTGAIVRLPQCQWSKPDGYGKISQCITTTKHSKAKTVCIFLGIYCIALHLEISDNKQLQYIQMNIERIKMICWQNEYQQQQLKFEGSR